MKIVLIFLFLVACGKESKEAVISDNKVDQALYQDESIRQLERVEEDQNEIDQKLGESCKIIFENIPQEHDFTVSAQIPEDCKQIFDKSMDQVYLRISAKTFNIVELSKIIFYNKSIDKTWETVVSSSSISIALTSKSNIEGVVRDSSFGWYHFSPDFADTITFAGINLLIEGLPPPENLVIEAFKKPKDEVL